MTTDSLARTGFLSHNWQIGPHSVIDGRWRISSGSQTIAEAGDRRHAQLIVAAVPLYQALEHILDLYGGDWPTPEHAVACDNARAALALAIERGDHLPRSGGAE